MLAIRRHRQRRRRQQLMLCVGGLLLVVLAAWRLAPHANAGPKIDMPPNFYRPEMLTGVNAEFAGQLQPLPLRDEDQDLKQRLGWLFSQYGAKLKPHLFYVNLQNGAYVNMDGDAAVAAASVIKLPILMRYFKQMDAGQFTPYQHLMYEPFEQAGGSGMLQYRQPGQPLLADTVATTMIQSSDNTCTNMLIYNMGGSKALNESFRDMGLRRTSVQNWLPDLTGTNVVSMRDTATILYNISESNWLSPQSRQAALKILMGTHNRRLLPALLPKNTVIAHKTGDIGTSLGNSGLITLPDGQKYIVSVQVERPYNDYSAKDLIQQASKMIYEDVLRRNTIATSATVHEGQPVVR